MKNTFKNFNINRIQDLSYKPIRTFSSTSVLAADNQLFERIEALRLKLETQNNMAKKEQLDIKEAQEDIKSLGNNIKALAIKTQQEKDSMAIYLGHFGKIMSQEDKVKAEKLLINSKKVEELFDKKICDEEKSPDSSILKLIKLQSTKEKMIHDAEDKVESLINKSVEKGISNHDFDLTFQTGYLAARAIRLKERNQFKQEEKNILSESASKLSPIDHVVDQMESAEPDYSDTSD